MSNEAKVNWKSRILDEMRKLMVIVLYLWVMLFVFQLHKTMVLLNEGIYYGYLQGLVFALVNALILGKFMLIAEALHAGERWEHKPLLYSIVFKAAVFSAILLACHLLEESVVKIWHSKTWAAATPDLSAGVIGEVFTMTLMAFVTLIPFFAARELARVLGKQKIRELFLAGERAIPGASAAMPKA